MPLYRKSHDDKHGEGNCSVSIDQTKTKTTGMDEVIGFKGLGLHHEYGTEANGKCQW